MNSRLADRIYSILVDHAGVDEILRENFVKWTQSGTQAEIEIGKNKTFSKDWKSEWFRVVGNPAMQGDVNRRIEIEIFRQNPDPPEVLMFEIQSLKNRIGKLEKLLEK